MKSSMRLRDRDSGAPDRLQRILRSAEPTRSMNDGEKQRFRLTVARIAATRPTKPESAFVLPNLLFHRSVALGLVAVFLSMTLIFRAREKNSALPMTADPCTSAPNSQQVDSAPTEAPSVRTFVEKTTSPSANYRFSSPSATIIERHDAPTKDIVDQFSHAPAPAPKNLPDSDSVMAVPPKLDDVVLLDQARNRLREKNPVAALAQIDQHARSFPSSPMATERELLAMDALVELGRREEARTRGEALLESVRGTRDEIRVQQKLQHLPGKMEDLVARNDDRFDVLIFPHDERTFVDSPELSALVWLHGAGDIGFEHFIRLPAGLGRTYRAMIHGDFDGDGQKDLAVISTDQQTFWLGTEDGRFESPMAASDWQVFIDDDDVAQDEGNDDDVRLYVISGQDDDGLTRAFGQDRNAPLELVRDARGSEIQ